MTRLGTFRIQRYDFLNGAFLLIVNFTRIYGNGGKASALLPSRWYAV
jgi:hypothetical protein